jgi:hypothetical protein
MKTIQEQIEALTQELRPKLPDNTEFYYFDGEVIDREMSGFLPISQRRWYVSLFASTNKAEVEDYADCYRRLKLYQLLGEKAAKEYPVEWVNDPKVKYATDLIASQFADGCIELNESGDYRHCVLGGVWFAREEDRLKALEICGIDRAFQERCAKHKLGGA